MQLTMPQRLLRSLHIKVFLRSLETIVCTNEGERCMVDGKSGLYKEYAAYVEDMAGLSYAGKAYIDGL
jgi:hypothetical protein